MEVGERGKLTESLPSAYTSCDKNCEGDFETLTSATHSSDWKRNVFLGRILRNIAEAARLKSYLGKNVIIQRWWR